MRVAILSFLCVFTLCASTLSASVGHLTQVSGLVKVYLCKNHSWVNGRSGLSISAGDKLKTSYDGGAILSYNDGSELRINKSSSLQFLASGYRLRYGNTWVRFVKQGKHFRTLTPNAVVSVRGTIYTVKVKRSLSSIMDDYKNTVASVPYLNDAPKAHVASSSLLLSLLKGAGTVSEVNVRRGCVAVSSSDSSDATEKLLMPGMSLYVSSKGVSEPVLSKEPVDTIWGSDFTELLKNPVRLMPGHRSSGRSSDSTYNGPQIKLFGQSPQAVKSRPEPK